MVALTLPEKHKKSTRVNPIDETRIKQALVNTLYKHSAGVLLTNIFVPIPSLLIFWGKVPNTWLVAWCVSVYLLTILRMIGTRAFFRHTKTPNNYPKWAWMAAGFSWLSGMNWGLLGLIGFLSGEPHLLSFAMIVMTGLTCGSVPTSSAFLPVLVGSLFTTVLPSTIYCLMSEGEIYNAYLFLIACLVIINVHHGRVTHRDLAETIRLRFENETLVDQLKSERDRVAAADRAKTRFLAAASHDLRQPVHALGLFNSTLAALAGRGNVNGADAANISGKIRSVVANLSYLLNALLDVSRLDAQIVTPNRETISIGELQDDLRNEFASLAESKGLRWRMVRCDLHTDSDPMMLRQIIANLIANAIRYTTSGGILFGCRLRGSNIEIQVYDTGIGIAENQHKTVFEEFVQLHNPERDRDKGLGLGLSIVKRTAELLNHPIRLCSQAGTGSMFSIVVPLVVDQRQPKKATRSPLQTGGNIFIIDDESTVLEALTGLVDVWGYQAFSGRNAVETYAAWQADKTAKPSQADLVIVDYRLEGGMIGTQAARRLFDQLGYELPVIILTGDTSPERLREASASGYMLLHKPIDPAELLQAIQKAI
ncbi:hybrid sensor histidine kinase/response regulator [Brucella sp. NBRC 12950]|uniref:ATP-binding response regulator n=1 Tax=Brucella sp. NBRC 12950 TaxID=2994518 RepID=UPI0024A2B71E|nr:hybrid sensor histidine kinase/response regulator [Brucella sp. NBRC 12950]GLU26172.1 hybrid sensor histidine kinase/response regulator [Brucella sp. NBRC 12950]